MQEDDRQNNAANSVTGAILLPGLMLVMAIIVVLVTKVKPLIEQLF